MFGEFSRIFGNLRKMFGNLREIAEISVIFGYLYHKQNITCPLVERNFVCSCSTRYLTGSLCSLVRYGVEHSKIKFVSTCGHVISSLCELSCSFPNSDVGFQHHVLCFQVKFDVCLPSEYCCKC